MTDAENKDTNAADLKRKFSFFSTNDAAEVQLGGYDPATVSGTMWCGFRACAPPSVPRLLSCHAARPLASRPRRIGRSLAALLFSIPSPLLLLSSPSLSLSSTLLDPFTPPS